MEKIIAEVATLKENAKWQNIKLENIERDTKMLLEWRWKLYGVNAIISAFTATILSVILAFIERK